MTFESEGLLIVAIYIWLPPASYVFSDNSGNQTLHPIWNMLKNPCKIVNTCTVKHLLFAWPYFCEAIARDIITR